MSRSPGSRTRRVARHRAPARPRLRTVARRGARAALLGARRASARATTALTAARLALAALLLEAALRLLTLPATARLAGVATRLDGSRSAAPGGPRREDGGGLELTPRESRDVRLALAVLRRGPVDDSCLRRSLLIGHVLRRRGPVLEIGVAKRDGVVRAHAWLEVDGAVLDDGAPEGYAVLGAPAPSPVGAAGSPGVSGAPGSPGARRGPVLTRHRTHGGRDAA